MYLAIVLQLSIIYSIQSAAQPDTQACGCCTPGIPGIPGNHGSSGYAGVKGDAGIKGEDGLSGEKGNRGVGGRAGMPGEIGPQGATGEWGIPGVMGEGGLTGETGPQGARGDVGLPGITGEKGEKGELIEHLSHLKSAFSVAFVTDQLEPRHPISPMKYKKIITNIGSDYSKDTGKFVCQHPGTYVFQFTSQKGTDGRTASTIIKNGQLTVSAYTDSTTFSISVSNMVVLDLVAGDEVWTQPLSLSYNYYFTNNNAYCSFSGFLLYSA